MKKILYLFLLFLFLFGSFLAGSWYSRREATRINLASAKSASAKADKRTVTGTDNDTGTGTGISTPPPGMVQVSAAKQQLIGVRTDEVRRAPASHLLRVPGRIAVDDGRLYRLIAAADGWIRELGENSAGSFVKKDQVLASYYTSNLLASTQTLVIALATNEQVPQASIGLQRGPTTLSLQVAIDSLRSLGMSDSQIEEIRQTRVAPTQIRVYSPINGFVIARNISPQQRFDKGSEMYRIADLSRVWVLADLFENEAQYIKAGAKVRISLPYQKKTFQGTVSEILPQFDAATRTLKVRLEVANPDFSLKPDMFVDVELPIDLPSAITVPADAVLDSGLRKTVFVDLGNGSFEPREVETGWRLGNVVEIKKGLTPGERIVMSGTFLIDSESRMEMAAAGMAETLAKDPVCGMEISAVKAAKAGRKSKFRDVTYYFCSDWCKEEFDKNPARFAKKEQ